MKKLILSFFINSILLNSIASGLSCREVLGNTWAASLLESSPATVRMTLDKAEVYVRGEAGLAQKIRLIQKAKPGDKVYLGYFIFESDYSSSYLVREMVKKAKEGVEFKVLIDYSMSEKYVDWLGFMASHKNIEVRRFRPPTKDFQNFLKNELKIANTNDFIKGLSTQNTQLIMSAMMSSPLLQAKLANANQFSTQLMGLEKAGLTHNNGNPVEMIAMIHSLIRKDDMNLAQQFLIQLENFTHRLHHKIFALESLESKGQVEMIVGGRNISDEYHLSLGHPFLSGRNYPFFDSEVGGLVKDLREATQVVQSFNTIWNNRYLILKVRPASMDVIEAQNKHMNDKAGAFEKQLSSIFEIADGVGTLKLGDGIRSNYTENKPNEHKKFKEIQTTLNQMIPKAENKIVIISAYLYLHHDMLKVLETAAAKGIKIEIYTNSPKSTDLSIVNLAAYTKFEEWTQRLGSNVKFYELQREPGQGSLHAKMIIIDGKIVGIGSVNIDPRNYLFDSNNIVFSDLSHRPAKVAELLSRYLSPQSQEGLQLLWQQINVDYVKSVMSNLNEEQRKMLPFLHIPTIINQM